MQCSRPPSIYAWCGSAVSVCDSHVKKRASRMPKIYLELQVSLAQEALEKGIRVADLGCGGGCLLVPLARRFPKSTFVGYVDIRTLLF